MYWMSLAGRLAKYDSIPLEDMGPAVARPTWLCSCNLQTDILKPLRLCTPALLLQRSSVSTVHLRFFLAQEPGISSAYSLTAGCLRGLYAL
jgi:hypothetical protein